MMCRHVFVIAMIDAVTGARARLAQPGLRWQPVMVIAFIVLLFYFAHST